MYLWGDINSTVKSVVTSLHSAWKCNTVVRKYLCKTFQAIARYIRICSPWSLLCTFPHLHMGFLHSLHLEPKGEYEFLTHKRVGRQMMYTNTDMLKIHLKLFLSVVADIQLNDENGHHIFIWVFNVSGNFMWLSQKLPKSQLISLQGTTLKSQELTSKFQNNILYFASYAQISIKPINLHES